jgi:hypothetical protein
MNALSDGGLRVAAWLAITAAMAVLSGVGVASAGSGGGNLRRVRWTPEGAHPERVSAYAHAQATRKPRRDRRR